VVHRLRKDSKVRDWSVSAIVSPLGFLHRNTLLVYGELFLHNSAKQ